MDTLNFRSVTLAEIENRGNHKKLLGISSDDSRKSPPMKMTNTISGKMYADDSSFYKYKVYADISGGSSGRGRQVQ